MQLFKNEGVGGLSSRATAMSLELRPKDWRPKVSPQGLEVTDMYDPVTGAPSSRGSPLRHTAAKLRFPMELGDPSGSGGSTGKDQDSA